MLDLTEGTLALRNRAIGVTVATTGSTSLSATSTGYARAAGSFLTDGFAVGMEITLVTGFSVSANNQATTAQGRVITGVTATAITCSGCATDAVASGRVITVGLPFCRAWENTIFTPVSGFPWVDEDMVPATSEMISAPYSGGTVMETGLYVLKYYGLAGKDVSAIFKSMNALLARFTPGTSLTAATQTVRVRGDQGPFVGQIIYLEGNVWAVATLTVPYRVYSTNAIA